MQFTLSSTLQQRIAKYDPELRARLRAEKAASKRTNSGPTYPLGLPVGLIPDSCVSADEFLRALQTINQSSAINRHEHWLTHEGNFRAAVWHVNAGQGRLIWVAAYTNSKRDTLHLAWAAKSADWARTRFKDCLRIQNSRGSIDPFEGDEAETIKNGRTTFLVRRWSFSLASIQASGHLATARDDRRILPSSIWNIGTNNGRAACSESTFGRQTRERVQQFACDLAGKRWSDGGDPFARIQSSWSLILDHPADASWVPTPSDVLTLERINTPWFRSQVAAVLADMQRAFDTPITARHSLTNPWNDLEKRTRTLKYLLQIWPDYPLDHLQSLWPFANHIDWRLNLADAVYAGLHGWDHEIREKQGTSPLVLWLRQNIPPATFTHWLLRAFDEDDTGLVTPDIRLFLRQIESYTVGGATWSAEQQRFVGLRELPKPKRLRLSDLNRDLEERLWKLKTPDEPLPQDLFPKPVRVTCGNQRVSFFQPQSVHQLAEWGSHVRNCVGNGVYAERIKKFQHFIVLGMVNGKPDFTIQLSHRDGQLITDQVVSTSNNALNGEQRLIYEQGMNQALQLQSEQLTDDQA